MLTPTQEKFFVLLRAGLWDKPVDVNELQNPEAYQETGSKKNTGSAPNTDIDWKAIYKIAREQTVVGLIADAIGTLPKDQRPPMPILQKIIMDKLAIEKSHARLNDTLNAITEMLNTEDIPSVLLKGQGVAQNYPHPTSRTCGDIDLYVGQANYEAACEMFLGLPNIEDGGECEHHWHFDYNGVTIEVHRKADMMEPQRIDRKFLAWTREQIDNNYEHKERLNPWDNNGTTIYRPTPLFDSVFILSHMFRHMVNGGVGLRQLTDWTMYLHAHHHEVNKDELTQILKVTNLTKIWKAFGSAAVLYMGLSSDELILPIRTNARLAEKVMHQIFISGNFGRADEVQRGTIEENYLRRKLHSFTFRLRRMFILWPMFPHYITTNFFGWIGGAIGRIFRHE